MRLALTSPAVACAITVVLAGCGDGGGTGSTSPTVTLQQAREDYRLALSSQCANARLEREAIAPPRGSGPRALARYLDDVREVARRYEEQADALDPPPELRGRHRQARALADEVSALIDVAARRARNGTAPEQVLRDLEPAVNARIVRSNALAEAIGAPQCKTAPLDLGFSDSGADGG